MLPPLSPYLSPKHHRGPSRNTQAHSWRTGGFQTSAMKCFDHRTSLCHICCGPHLPFLKDRPPRLASLPGRLRAAQLDSFSRRIQCNLRGTWAPLAGAARGLMAIVRPTLEKLSVQTGALRAQLAQYPADPQPFSQRIGAECPQRYQYILSLQ